ncbi:MAG: methyltransferase type 11 [uncultured bacterium]|nr:MAG: methyltransferase type 11 [uncultured bacterium]HBD05520.1 hypothetical protein [Candidatus Uhrbacteria bacterium]
MLLDPKFVLEQAQLAQGMSVTDLGAGNVGHFVIPASRIVGENGSVCAVDIQQSALSGIESRALLEGLSNIQYLQGDIERENGVNLPSSSQDIVLIVNNLGISKHKDKIASEALRLAKVSGKVVVVDWKPSGAIFGLGPKQEDRVSKEESIKLFASKNFKIDKIFNAGTSHWGFIAVRVA